jgi:hypothetical protein
MCTPVLKGCSNMTMPVVQDFMTAVSLQCKLKNHHPEWSNVLLPLHLFFSIQAPIQ